jgi:hypothetical protein
MLSLFQTLDLGCSRRKAEVSRRSHPCQTRGSAWDENRLAADLRG